MGDPAAGMPCGAPTTREQPDRLSILQEADLLVNGPRQADYGHPRDDFARTAALVNVVLARKLVQALEPQDVALFMVCVKLSRECNRPKRDNRVDAAGYLATLDMIVGDGQ